MLSRVAAEGVRSGHGVAELSEVRCRDGAAGASSQQCPEGHGVFLERADLGSLIEAETDWNSRSVHDTARLPRITSDMTEPPAPSPHARAWVETLF